jgi:hypothetical protein
MLQIDAKSDRVQIALAFAKQTLREPLTVELLADAAPSRSRRVSSAFCRRCPALRPPPLRSSGTELPQPDFRQGRFVRAVTRSMCWQKFDPPLDPRTHSAIRFDSRNSHSIRFKRRPSSSQVTCGAKPLTNLRPRPWQGITHAMKSPNSIQSEIRATVLPQMLP